MASTPAGKKPAPKRKTSPAAGKKAAGVAAPKTKTRTETKAKKPLGAPSIYTQDLALAICEHVANCVPLAAIAAMDGMPSVRTIMNWLADERKPDFVHQYARAREAQADKMAEDILAIADEECTMVRSDKHGSRDDDGEGRTEVVFDAIAVARNRLRVDARKWLASKMAPKKYGEKVQNELTGPDGGALQVASTVTFVRPPPRREDDE